MSCSHIYVVDFFMFIKIDVAIKIIQLLFSSAISRCELVTLQKWREMFFCVCLSVCTCACSLKPHETTKKSRAPSPWDVYSAWIFGFGPDKIICLSCSDLAALQVCLFQVA